MKNYSNLKISMGLIGLVKPLGGYMALAVFLGVLGYLSAMLIPAFGGVAFLNLMNIPTGISVGTIFILVSACAVLRGFLRYGEQYLNHFIAFKLLALLRDKVFSALRRLCPAKLDGKEKGNLIAIITSDIELLEVFYAHTISPVLIALIMSLGISGFMYSLHPVLGCIALLAYATIGLIIPLAVSKISGDSGVKYRKKSGELSSFVLDSLRGLPEILQYSAGEKRLNTMMKKTKELCEDEKIMKRQSGGNAAISSTVILIFTMAMLFASGSLFMGGHIGFSAVVISVITIASSFAPVVALASLGSSLQNTFAAANRVLGILRETPVVDEVAGKIKCTFLGAEAKNLSFSYGGEKILDNVSAKIPQNSIIGITGKSGSGKSTFLKLLMSFWQVNSGEIMLSGRCINHVNTKDLRNMQGFMTQETHMFHDSIINNLKIAKPLASIKEIENACKKAAIHEFILSLPKGYNTKVGELGERLSGGERQRIGLARVFLYNAPMLLLDEPTSNLDNLNEAIILNSIAKERKNKTVVLVSHRISTMSLADKVYSMENGRVS